MRLFWKILIRTLEAWEYKTLYKWDKRALKDIIVSSGWMLQWWAIMNHLKEVISDPNAKIIFTWYQALWTIWQKILSWEKQIIIEWEIYNVRCEVAQIKWYSSHIWASDIETYISELNYSKKAKIILNHGWESREILANVIREINSRVEVIVPSLYDEVNLWL
jgi:predicted metal-dependent RNase